MSDVDEAMGTQSEGSSIGEAASGRPESGLEEEVEDEDEDLYYIPPRRPSLDLGPSPMDTTHWYGEMFDLQPLPVLLSLLTLCFCSENAF